ncbi:MAG TPA: DinB family protein [Mucilaginibacter sp.]|jgi:hypothetical protein
MEKIAGEIRDVIDNLLNADINSIQWDYKPSPEKWSKKQIIGHLIDSAMINLQRFVRCTFEENFKLTYEQVEWVEAQRYQHADVKELLALWQLLNKQIFRVLKNYPPERLQANCDNSKTMISLHSVEWLAQDYVDHMKHHLKQIH